MSSALPQDLPTFDAFSEDTRACISRLRDHKPERSDLSNQPTSRLAAVLVLLYEKAGELRVLLTQRSMTLRTHAGQTALPGGRMDDTDADFIETAFREAYEEIGLAQNLPQIHVLCLLRPFVSLNKLLVTPVVAFLEDPSVLGGLTASQHEVARIFDHPIRGFLDPNVVERDDLVPIGSEDWPYDEELHSTSDSVVQWLDGAGYRMHRFRSVASPIKGLTADIMIMVATIAFDCPTQYDRYAPGQAIGFDIIWRALLMEDERGKVKSMDTNTVSAAQSAVNL